MRRLIQGRRTLHEIPAIVLAEITSGYIVGYSRIPGVTALGEIRFAGRDATAGSVQQFDAPGTRILFPELPSNMPSRNGARFLAGLVLLNPQGLLPRTTPVRAEVKIAILTSAGNEIASTYLTLDAAEQVTRLLFTEGSNPGFFQALDPLASHLVVTSDMPIAGSLMIFADDLTEILAVQGQDF